MLQFGCLSAWFRLYRPKLLRCTAKKRPAGGGQDQPPDGTVRRSTLQALKYCRMLTVYRQQVDTPAGSCLHNKSASRHQRFLVGERHVPARLDRCKGRQQTDHAHHRVSTISASSSAAAFA